MTKGAKHRERLRDVAQVFDAEANELVKGLDRQQAIQLLLESGATRKKKSAVISCALAKYEMTRNPGNRDNPRTRREYYFTIDVAPAEQAPHLSLKDIGYKDPFCTQ